MVQPHVQNRRNTAGKPVIAAFDCQMKQHFAAAVGVHFRQSAIVPIAARLAFCYELSMTGSNPDPDDNGPIELWGTRIGRGLGFLITIGIILALIVWLGAAKP
jgi:hypothetical protein